MHTHFYTDQFLALSENILIWLLCLVCTCVIVVESDVAKKVSLFDSVRRPCEKLFQNMRFLTFTPKMGPGIPNQNNFWSHSILSQSFRYDMKLKLCVPVRYGISSSFCKIETIILAQALSTLHVLTHVILAVTLGSHESLPLYIQGNRGTGRKVTCPS